MKLFITHCQKSDGLYSYEVEACDFAHAQQIATERDLGEIVGEVACKIPADQTTPERVDAMCRAFAENGTIPD